MATAPGSREVAGATIVSGCSDVSMGLISLMDVVVLFYLEPDLAMVELSPEKRTFCLRAVAASLTFLP
jgi:hypothetical protein